MCHCAMATQIFMKKCRSRDTFCVITSEIELQACCPKTSGLLTWILYPLVLLSLRFSRNCLFHDRQIKEKNL